MSEPLFTLGLAHHPNEYMPKMRACLGLHDLATGAECQDRLDTLRGHYEADRDGDKDGHNEGIKLADHLLPLRDLFGDQALGMTWEDLLDRVEGMIDAAMDEHVAQYHGGAQMTDKPVATETAPTTETNEMDPKLLKDAEEKAKTFEDKAKTAEDKSKALETANAELTAQVTALSDKVKAGEESVKKAEGVNASNAVLIEIVEAVTAVALKDEKPKEVVLRLVEDNKKLLSEKVKRDEADLTRDVEETIATYADKKGLTLADKPHLMKQARADRESFNALYPPIPADKRHLLRSIVPSEKRPEAEKPILSVSALTSKLMSDKNLSYIDASDAAANIIAGKTTLEDFLGKK